MGCPFVHLLVARLLLVVVLAKLALFLPLFRLTYARTVASSGIFPARCMCGVTFLFGGRWMSVVYFVAIFIGWVVGLDENVVVSEPELVLI